MRKIVMLLMLLSVSTIKKARACDWCGCAPGSAGVGILPGIKKSFVATRVSANYSIAYNEHSQTTEEARQQPHSEEASYTSEVWTRINIKEKVHMFVFVPFVVNTKSEEGILDRNYGFGDIVLLGNVVLLNTADSLGKKIKHHLMIGGGIKFPTGSFGRLNSNGLLIPNMQTGTGTIDFLTNAIYTIRYRNWGIQSDVSYKYNLTNKSYNFRFGNRTNTALRAYYWHAANKTMLMPFVGALYEYAEKDMRRDRLKEKSGGQGVFANIGIQTFFWKMGASVQWSQPIVTHYAEGFIKQQPRWNAQIQLFF